MSKETPLLPLPPRTIESTNDPNDDESIGKLDGFVLITVDPGRTCGGELVVVDDEDEDDEDADADADDTDDDDEDT